MAVSQQKKKATQESFLDMTPQDSAINGRGKNELSEEFLLNFLNSIQAMAVGCIDDFFHNEKLYCGGDIEQDLSLIHI